MNVNGGQKSSLLKLVVLILIAVGLTTAITLLPMKEYLIVALDWTANLGPLGPIVVILFYIVACIFLIPGSLLTIGAGFLFGVGWGTVTVSIGSVIGAAAAFLIGRTLARDWISKKVAHNPTFNSIDEAVGKEGFKLVFLLRLSPVFPFTIINYALGLTKVSFSKYFFASWIGMLPGTLMYVYFGSAARSLTDIAAGHLQGGVMQQVFFWFGLAVTVVVATIVTRIAQKSLKQAQPSKEGK